MTNTIPATKFFLFLLTVAALLAACSDNRSTESSGANSGLMQKRTLEHDGNLREFFVMVPQGAQEKLPVVVGIHGYTSTASGFAATHGLKRHARGAGYILVVPQGMHFRDESDPGQSYLVTSWNDLAANMPPTEEGPHCTQDSHRYPCPPDCESCLHCGWTSCADDVGFIEKMLDAVHAEFDTDESRTYLLGVSNGAMMTLRLGCSLPERFAAIAPIIGQLAPGYACGPGADLPMIHLFGGKDDTVRVDGRPAGDGFIYTTPEKTASVWASAMSCDAGPVEWVHPVADAAGLQCTAYSSCRLAGQEVVSCLDPDGTHQWPEQAVQGMPATCITEEQYDSIPDQYRCPDEAGEYVHLGMDLVWDFFSRYRR